MRSTVPHIRLAQHPLRRCCFDARRQTAVTAYFPSKQLPPFASAIRGAVTGQTLGGAVGAAVRRETVAFI